MTKRSVARGGRNTVNHWPIFFQLLCACWFLKFLQSMASLCLPPSNSDCCMQHQTHSAMTCGWVTGQKQKSCAESAGSNILCIIMVNQKIPGNQKQGMKAFPSPSAIHTVDNRGSILLCCLISIIDRLVFYECLMDIYVLLWTFMSSWTILKQFLHVTIATTLASEFHKCILH